MIYSLIRVILFLDCICTAQTGKMGMKFLLLLAIMESMLIPQKKEVLMKQVKLTHTSKDEATSSSSSLTKLRGLVDGRLKVLVKRRSTNTVTMGKEWTQNLIIITCWGTER